MKAPQAPCPYTVGRRVCVAGPKDHPGPHDWPKPGQISEYTMRTYPAASRNPETWR